MSNAGTALEEINTYVTYPNQFQPEIQQFLKKAAEEARFPNVIMINATVAAMHYAVTHDNKKSVNLLQTSKGKQNIMLIDMGAGTTDINVSFIRIKFTLILPGKLEPVRERMKD